MVGLRHTASAPDILPPRTATHNASDSNIDITMPMTIGTMGKTTSVTTVGKKTGNATGVGITGGNEGNLGRNSGGQGIGQTARSSPPLVSAVTGSVPGKPGSPISQIRRRSSIQPKSVSTIVRDHAKLLGQSRSSALHTLQRLLLSFCPSARTHEHLQAIHAYLQSYTNMPSEPVWNLLDRKIQNKLCKEIIYRQVIDNHGHQFVLARGQKSAVYIMLHGEAMITYVGGVVDAGDAGGGSVDGTVDSSGSNCLGGGSLSRSVGGSVINIRKGEVFGSLYLPQTLREERDKKAKTLGLTGNVVGTILEGAEMRSKMGGKEEKIIVSIKKGSEYILLPSSPLLPFLTPLTQQLSIQNLLRSLGLTCMLPGSGKESSRPLVKMVTLPRGKKIIAEGERTRFVYAIMEGECKMTKARNTEKVESDGWDAKASGLQTAGVQQAGDVGGGENIDVGGGADGVEKREKKEDKGESGEGEKEKKDRQLEGEIAATSNAKSNAHSTNKSKAPLQNSRYSKVLLPSGFIGTIDGRFMGMLGPRSLLGDLPNPQPVSVVTATDVRALQFSIKDYNDKLEMYPDLKQAFNGMAMIRSRWIEQRWAVATGKLDKRKMIMLRDLASKQSETIHKQAHRASSMTEEERKEAKSIYVDTMKRKAILEEKVQEGPPEITFEMMFLRRVKKNPKVNRTKLLTDFKRRLLGEEEKQGPVEYVEPEDPFQRYDFIDADQEEYKASPDGLDWSLLDGNGADDSSSWEGKFADHEILDPYPTITKERKLHGKSLPLVRRSDGYQCPFKSMIEVKVKERERDDRNMGAEKSMNLKHKKEIDQALKEGFLPLYLRDKLSGKEFGSLGGSTTGGSSVFSGGLGVGESMGSLGKKSLGSSIWTINDNRPSIYDNSEVKGYYDLVKRGGSGTAGAGTTTRK